MSKTIDFYFDVGSPASYLAWTQLPGLAERCNATIEWKPMLLGAVFKATGNASPAANPLKAEYSLIDIDRCARDFGVAFRFNPHFPVNTLYLMRGATAYLGTPQLQDYLKMVFEGLWVKGLDMSDPNTLLSEVEQAGLDAQLITEAFSSDSVKQTLKDITSEAISRKVFGAPTFFADDEMFFGQDRLAHLEKHLNGAL